jgi:hypothetical protein
MTDDGLALMKDGIAAYRGLKSPPVFLPLLLYLYGTACGTLGRHTEGLAFLDQALEIAAESPGDGLASEFLGMKGELMLAVSRENAPEVERLYQLAMSFATRAGAQMFELRLAIRLSRLWQAQGKTAQAHALLSDSYNKLTEGFETPDLRTARELLAQLSN